MLYYEVGALKKCPYLIDGMSPNGGSGGDCHPGVEGCYLLAELITRCATSSPNKRSLTVKLWREDMTALRALPLQGLRRAHLKITGPVNLGVILHPRVALVVWWWHGRHYHRTIRRVLVSRTPYRSCSWLCPTCGRRCRVVLFHPPDIVGCVKCLGVCYRQWQRSGREREPKSPHLWVKWFTKRLAAKARGMRFDSTEIGT